MIMKCRPYFKDKSEFVPLFHQLKPVFQPRLHLFDETTNFKPLYKLRKDIRKVYIRKVR